MGLSKLTLETFLANELIPSIVYSLCFTVRRRVMRSLLQNFSEITNILLDAQESRRVVSRNLIARTGTFQSTVTDYILKFYCS